MRHLGLISACTLLILISGSLVSHANWEPTGLGVCVVPGTQYYSQIKTDGNGGAYIVWHDSRLGGNMIFAQRVDAHGRPQWAADGIPVTTSAAYATINIASAPDGDDGVIIVWRDARIPEGIYAQRLDRDGTILWDLDGEVVCDDNIGSQYYPQVVPDGAGGVVAVWEDLRGGLSDIYAQRLDENGTPLWTPDGVPVCVATGDQEVPRIATDGSAFFLVWEDGRAGANDIFAQKLDLSGTPLWTADGVAVCSAVDWQHAPAVIPNFYGGAIIAWQDFRSGSQYDVYISHLNNSGSAQWGADGKVVSAAVGQKQHPALVHDGLTAGCVVVWDVNSDIYAQRFNGYGGESWTPDGVAVCRAPSTQIEPRAVQCEDGGTVFLWTDYRVPYQMDLYTQKLDADGNALWETDGLAIGTPIVRPYSAQLVTDGDGGAIIAWHETSTATNSHDIFAQRFEQNGYWGYPAPEIHNVKDVPGDQGGLVNLSWYASRLDPPPDATISHYSIWRAIDEATAKRFLASTTKTADVPPVRKQLLDGQTYFWEYVQDVAAYHLDTYAETVPTLFDSTATSADWHRFQLIAHTTDPLVFWVSAPDSGRSVDNLAPETPQGLVAQVVQTVPEGLLLSWVPNGEIDLEGYTLHRGTDPGFVPDAGTLLTTTADTLFVDAGWTWDNNFFYKLSALDIHGNESDYRLLEPMDVSAAGDGTAVPRSTGLAGVYPNPFNPQTRVRYDLAREAVVKLDVYDVQGALVRTLVTGRRAPGRHTAIWDGRDNAGGAVASGVYLARLTAAGVTQQQKMVLLK